MKKRIFCFMAAVLFCICFTQKGFAVSDAGDYEDSHLRIFTPYHNVKSVNSQNIDSEISNNEFHLTDEDIRLIAGVVHAESKGEPFKGKVGVASVILNRLYNPGFPKTVKDVIFQKNAFSCIKNGCIELTPSIEAYEAVREALNGNDPTNEAVFFYNPKTAKSQWMKNVSKDDAVTIGNHVFFK